MQAEKSIRRRELLLILLILSAAGLCFALTHLFHSAPAAVVEIAVDGDIVAELPLDVDQEFTAAGPAGGTNHVVIRDGEVWVSEADCPDKLCVRQGKISRSGEILVCLPNRMTAKITGGN